MFFWVHDLRPVSSLLSSPCLCPEVQDINAIKNGLRPGVFAQVFFVYISFRDPSIIISSLTSGTVQCKSCFIHLAVSTCEQSHYSTEGHLACLGFSNTESCLLWFYMMKVLNWSLSTLGSFVWFVFTDTGTGTLYFPCLWGRFLWWGTSMMTLGMGALGRDMYIKVQVLQQHCIILSFSAVCRGGESCLAMQMEP